MNARKAVKRLILRADDLGFSEGVNLGIEKSVRDGLIRTVGVMTNMEASEHGVKLLSGRKLCWGLHTNISAGRPLSDPEKIPSLTTEDGFFKTSKVYRSTEEDLVNLDEVILEIEAQLARFRELVGEDPHYFEGHAVRSQNFNKGLQMVAERHGLRYLEMNPDAPVPFGRSMLYLHMESMKPNYEPMNAIRTMQFHLGEGEADFFICHPGYLDAAILRMSSLQIPRTQDLELAVSRELREYVEEEEIQMLTYDDVW